MPPKFIGTTIAAQRLKISPRRVQVLCEEGRITGAYRIGRQWIIPEKFKVLPPQK